MAKVNSEMDGKLAILKFADPPTNLLSAELIADLTQAVDNLDSGEVRGMLLCADGDNFSAGADVKLFSSLSPQEAEQKFTGFFKLLHKMESLPYPTMAAVQGICIAGGLEVALTTDMIWASDTAMFGQVEALIGAIPFGGGAQRLAARCGVIRAKEIVFSGRFYTAAKFEQYNIINRVVPAQELKAKALNFMKMMAESGPTLSYKAVKEILTEYSSNGTAAADKLTIERSAAMFDTKDLKTGVSSFLKAGPGKAIFEGK